MVRPASGDPGWTQQVDLLRADLRVQEDLVSAFEGVDAVIHLAAAVDGDDDVLFASTVIGTERFLEAMARSAVKRLVFASSFVVYDWKKARSRIDEDTPLANDIYQRGGYDIAKYWQERVVLRAARAHGWQLTVLRPGFVWGRGRESIAGMGRMIGPLIVMIGPISRLPLTHVENCADCFVTAAENPSAIGRTFNVVDSDDIRVWRYVREYVHRTGRRGIPVLVPYRFGLGVAHLAATVNRLVAGDKGRLPSLLTPPRFEAQFKPLRFSNARLREILGWRPPLSFDECLARTYGPR
jgi:UDP-glucose 4-epimerase